MLNFALDVFVHLYHFFVTNIIYVIGSLGTLFTVIRAFILYVPWGTILDVSNKLFSLLKNALELIAKFYKKMKKTKPTTIHTTSVTTNTPNAAPLSTENPIVLPPKSINVGSKTTSEKVTKRIITYPDGSSYTEETFEKSTIETF